MEPRAEAKRTMNKGTYYKTKTKKWFQKDGFHVEYLEKNQRIFVKGKVIFIKRDVFGADGLAMNTEKMIFWQCKLNKKNIAEAIKEFNKFPYPKACPQKCIERWIVVWTPRAREPEIIEVE